MIILKLINIVKIFKYYVKACFFKAINSIIKSDKMAKNISKYDQRIKSIKEQNRSIKLKNDKLQNKNDNLNILIIGRLRVGDSIARFTEAFLQSIDFSCTNVHVFDEYSRDLYKFNASTNKQFIKRCFPRDINGKNYDMMLFLGVLNHGTDNFWDKVPEEKALINFAYSVFDGTILPKGWADAINRYFDGVFVPIDALKKVYETNEVYKPVFTLPISLDLDFYLKYNPLDVVKKDFTFGWIGTLSERKNPLKILRAFIEEFSDNPDVKLVMHSRYRDNEQEYNNEFLKLLSKAPSNVIFTEGVLSEDNIKKLMTSFDTYVYASKGEGYSNSAREALACGHSVVLSAIPAHTCITDLNENDGVLFVKADKAVDATQTSLNNQYIGKMFDLDEDDLQKAMRTAYKKRSLYKNVRLVEKRKVAASFYDKSYLTNVFKQIIRPVNVNYSTENLITRNSISINNLSLLEKYKRLLCKKAPKLYCLPARDGGFCSLFNQYMVHQVYASDDELIVPDWRSTAVKIYNVSKKGRSNFESFCYGKEEDGNIFFKCFDRPYKNILTDLECETDILYTDSEKIIDPDDYNSKKEPNLTYTNSYNLYEDAKYFQTFRNKYNAVFERYLKLNSKIQDKVDNFYNKKLKGYFVISALMRCPAHALELKSNDRQSFDVFEKNIKKILKEVNISVSSDEWRLFCASDNDVAIKYFKDKYGNHIVSQKMKRLSKQQIDIYDKKKRELGKDVCGYELQHIQASNDSSFIHAEEILFDVFMCAKSEYFIFQNSNISTMISYINPNLKMIYNK